MLLGQFLESSHMQKNIKITNRDLLLTTGCKLLVTSSDLMPKCVLDCIYLPSPKSFIYIYIEHPSYLFRAVPQSYLRQCLPGYSPHFSPNTVFILLSCVSFSVNRIKMINTFLLSGLQNLFGLQLLFELQNHCMW